MKKKKITSYNLNATSDEEWSVSLANAIIKQACDDFIADKITHLEFRNFIYGEWFEILTDADPNYIYQEVIKRKNRRDRL